MGAYPLSGLVYRKCQDKMVYLKELWQIFMDLGANGASAIFSFVAGLPHRDNVVRIHLMERNSANVLSYLRHMKGL